MVWLYAQEHKNLFVWSEGVDSGNRVHGGELGNIEHIGWIGAKRVEKGFIKHIPQKKFVATGNYNKRKKRNS